MANYTPLFSVAVSHNYFNGSHFPVLDVSPDPATENVMKNLDLILQKTDYGFTMHYNAELFNAQQALAAFTGKKLSLFLNIADDDFFNYTLLPASVNSFLCFTNANHNFGNPQGNQNLPLSVAASAGQADMYQLSASFLTVPVAAADRAHTKLTDAFGNVIQPSQIATNSIQYTQLDGIYYLYQGHAKTALYCNTNAYTKKPLAVFELYLANTHIAAPYNIYNAAGQMVKNFTLNFDSRSVIWRYYIVNKTNAIVNNLSITTSNNKIKFVNKGNTSVASYGTTIFVSGSTIKVVQYPMEEFNLVLKEGGNSGKNIVESVPIPSMSTLKVENNTDYISAYVYI